MSTILQSVMAFLHTGLLCLELASNCIHQKSSMNQNHRLIGREQYIIVCTPTPFASWFCQVINPELAIEIVLGSDENTKVVFRDLVNEGNLGEVDATFLLSCTEQRAFWLSWHNGTVQVGSGPVYPHNLLLSRQVRCTFCMSRAHIN